MFDFEWNALFSRDKTKKVKLECLISIKSIFYQLRSYTPKALFVSTFEFFDVTIINDNRKTFARLVLTFAK
ncbi:hypothetical protein DP115_30815 [Brasilonema octagenarum UFV-OR1]|jgi:hypothetical protein|uniref:Uncharacterized protein n=1 Tax=Brasilonema octagenarum UFV-OR1 TaxID=417115 RepID=A0ABX1ME37_9CYAN|nr:hypothetical protein [Brasilonema octagenarum UFV-OR1]